MLDVTNNTLFQPVSDSESDSESSDSDSKESDVSSIKDNDIESEKRVL